MSNHSIPLLEDYSRASVEAAFGKVFLDLQSDAATLVSTDDIEAFRLRWDGRKQGKIQAISRSWLKNAPSPDAKKLVGEQFAILQAQYKTALADALGQVVSKVYSASNPGQKQSLLLTLAGGPLDITLPGTRRAAGIEHPLVKMSHEIVAVFKAMGYSVATGPEVETDYYNFESLNFPPNHPARDTQDTLVIAEQDGRPLRERLLMRTHTSPVQIRTMEKTAPPLRIVIPGKVYRNEAEDATHLARFQQVEGLCVDTNITFSDLKGTLDHAMKALFGSNVKTRFFPSFFPFTEPSADMQMSCIFCDGKGCRKCKHSGWIELLGCGMVDPAVFGFVGYDTKKYSGFAFGMGVERIAMMKYGVSNVGNFYSADMRFLEQFA